MAGRDGAKQRARTWPQGRALPWRVPRPLPLSDLLHSLSAYGLAAIAVDFGPGRLVPWLPVAFGLGIALYFSAEHEPLWMAAVPLAAALAALCCLLRLRPVAFPVALMLAAASAGFAVATVRTAMLAHPFLDRPVYGAVLSGFVEVREERERSDRIVVRVHRLEPKADIMPERVRLSVRRGMAPAVGSFVSLKARLNPPLAQLRPGGYDFARDLFFQRIGAVGFVTGPVKVEVSPAPPGLWLRYASFVDRLRDVIDRRIRQTASGDAGAIASALITGKRDAISAPVNDAMYVSSLAHVLSISGYHMAVVAGVVFFMLRAGLALMPGIAIRYPIKKWGALAALVAAAFYLALSGAEVATQRAFVMTAIVLVGVMADRAALTLRTLAVAAMAVLLFTPEAVVHPSFQMSFAATLALVAAYERGVPWIGAGADTSLGARIALWGGREMTALLLASLVAGLATTPYAAFHFHRAAPYGVLANLLAMPIVSAWVMPAGLMALVVLPFGFDPLFWRLMAAGIDWMVAVAVWVAGLPGAVGRIPAFGVGALLLATAGLIVLCLLRSRLRWSGALLVAMAAAAAAVAPAPDVWISPAGDAVAARGTNGRLAVMRSGQDALAIRDWLAADGDARQPNDPSLQDGWVCDGDGCIERLRDGTLVALARSPSAVAEDCERAALVVTTRTAPPQCRALAIDRASLRVSGAVVLRRTERGWAVEASRPPGYDRPWSPQAATSGGGAQPPARGAPTPPLASELDALD